MAVRSGMTSLVSHLRQHSNASTSDVFNGVTYWTDDQLQDVLDQYAMIGQTIPLVKISAYDKTNYKLNLTMPYWLESGFKIYVRDTTVEETTGFTYNPLTHQIVFDSDIAETRDLVAHATVYVMTDAIASVWEQKAQHRENFITNKAGSNRFQAEQIVEHCKMQACYWRNLRVRSFKRRSSRFA
jgi:hypothetical protein